MVALADRYGVDEAAHVLAHLDGYYVDQHGGGRGVAAQVARQLGDARPADVSVSKELRFYRNLDRRWTDWQVVRTACRELAAAMAEAEDD